MTDRELLELAAKAAGLLPPPDGKELDHTTDGGLAFCGNGEFEAWNPLQDDGDALRLAVELSGCDGGIAIMLNSRFDSYGCATIHTDADHKSSQESMRDDPYAATRRAIVRAAAEIGKEKP